MSVVIYVQRVTTPAGGAAKTQVSYPPAGRLVAIHTTAPALDSNVSYKVAIADAANAAIIHLPDTVHGGGACAHDSTTSTRFAASNGGYYPLPSVNRVGVNITITAAGVSATAKTFTVSMVIETA